MPRLIITEFSCIEYADFELSRINVVIGPQGSGKSVTTKLFYFFNEILSSYLQAAERQDSLDLFKKQIIKQFYIWFPSAAWGPSRFNIQFYAGPFSARVLRRMSGGHVSDEVSLTFSDWFNKQYAHTVRTFGENRPDDELFLDGGGQIRDAFEKTYRLREIATVRMSREMGSQYLGQQTFIPAGRAFFTSIGRLVAGFEQAGSFDPVTIRFARLFSSLRDRNLRLLSASRFGSDFIEKRSRYMNDLFGGEIKIDEDNEYLETEDGRKVPFTSLSSGQQELLPMWSIMDYFNEIDARRSVSGALRSRRARELVYIEEPEAHLFPSAQSLLMQFLIGSIMSSGTKSLIITTHSPYIMSQLNVYLKAGQLAKRKKKNLEINEIVPRECWLTRADLSAFAIQDRSLVNIVDDDEGLIDGTYLDGISEGLSRDFSALLKIESEI